MQEFFSNTWVVSVVSGILVFIITNAFMMFQDKRHNKKQIFDANTMILNHLRSYVVDNGLPEIEIIDALKHSIAREYNVKYEELLTIRSVCEDLIKDILGNIYISNDSQEKYITMLQNYIKQINVTNIDFEKNSENINSLPVTNYKTKIYMSSFAGLTTSIMGFLMIIFDMDYTISSSTIVTAISAIIVIVTMIYVIKIKKYKRK